jgi:hypothetical protein
MTIDELLAIEEIRQLRYLYAVYLDSGEIDKLVALFLEDGVAEFPESMGGPWVGRKHMHEGWSRVFSGYVGPFDHLHVATNPFVRLITPETATGRYYGMSMHTSKSAEGLIGAAGIHDDLYRKVSGRWYFEKTRFDFLYPRRSYVGPRIPF